LIFSHEAQRPERYPRSRRLETIPSSPSRQAWANISAPPSSRCSTYRSTRLRRPRSRRFSRELRRNLTFLRERDSSAKRRLVTTTAETVHHANSDGDPLEGAMRTLLKSVDHKEALRLTRKSWHFPFGTVLALCWIVAAVLSAVLTILAQGPHNAIP